MAMLRGRGSRILCAILAGVAAASTLRAAEVQDDRYRFLPGAGEERALELVRTEKGLRFAWAAPAGAAWDTALLGVRSAGAEAEPWVEIQSGCARLRQYLDPGARGLRWLNLSGLREQLSDGASVEIEVHGVTLEPGSAPLRVFANGLDLTRPVLILAPHPDDAEIAAFGLYATSAAATIVTVTAGNAGDFNYRSHIADPAEHYLFKGWLRAVDSVTVPWLGGVPPERCFNLGYFDARLMAMRARPDEPVSEMYGPNRDIAVYRRANIGRLLPNGARTATWAHLVEDLVEILRRVKPAVVVMPHPWLDTHADHQYVAVAAVEALERWSEPARFLLYTNHAFENLYPFGPAGTVVSLPPWSRHELPVEGIYSHPLSAELQRRKLFALESMHDLRLSPAEQAACGTPGAVARREDYPRTPAVDYFRRAPRPEELFFVFGRDGVRELIRAFLAAQPSQTDAPDGVRP
jgi:LmbE family N-acetylglucosaminyl deacetylase